MARTTTFPHRGRTEAQFIAALEDIVRSVNNGLIDDEECARRLDEIGATDEDLEAYF